MLLSPTHNYISAEMVT